MKEKHIDADKICKHIQYTQHWLEKADNDIREQRFSSGGVILNIARAELTAAWEELVQFKQQVVTTLPAKTKANWRPVTSAGLLASGFLIALLLTKFTSVPVPGYHEMSAPDTPPVTIVQPQVQETVEQPAAVPVVEEAVAEPETTEPVKETTGATVKTEKSAPAAKPVVRAPSPKPAPAKPPAVEEPAVLPFSPVGSRKEKPVARETEDMKPADRQLEQSEIIELFNTAQEALRD